MEIHGINTALTPFNSKQTGKQCQPSEAEPVVKKTRKVFDKAELAAMDAVYTASNGLPDSSMIERLANSFLVEKEQV